jgi:predicted nucleic acid-binding protein
VIALDAHAVLAALKGEPAGPEVRGLMEDGPAELSPLGVAEVIDHLVRITGADETEAALDVAALDLAPPRPVDEALGRRAGLLRARHYHRSHRAVSLADCVLAEYGRQHQLVVATADPALLDLCHKEGIPVRPLPDSDGRTWAPPVS